MVLRLCETLEVPLRERNTLLLAGGFAPAYGESTLDDSEMSAVRSALEVMLTTHEPYPAVVVDRLWNVVLGNRAMDVLMTGIPEQLLRPQPNVFRLVLHPDGLSAQLANARQVRELFLHRLIRQVDSTGDERLRDLHTEVCAYPEPAAEPTVNAAPVSPFEVPIRIRTPAGELSMFSTMATFGAPADVMLSELAIELFYPLDEFTRTTLVAAAHTARPAEGTPAH